MMGKKKGFDFIAEAHERANHNINPGYWFNRVTPFMIAQWNADKRLAPFYFVLVTVMEIAIVFAYNENAISENKSFWLYLFDFSNSFTAARCVGLLFFSFLWVIIGITAVQATIQRIYTRHPANPKQEKKKKYPKRPKNWK
jgi:hypothetical protein